MSAPFILALAQFPVFAPRDWPEFEARIEQWVAEATAHGAKLLLFPEYASMSLAATFSPAIQSDLHVQIVQMQALRNRYVELHQRLAQTYSVYLVAGSFPWEVAPGRFHNRTHIHAPNGRSSFQDKCVMTRFEREQWDMRGSEETRLFRTALGDLAIAICYDAEFPLAVRAQALAGAQLILVPSCTDGVAGWQRVRAGARARALENQCYVGLAPLVGEAPWSPAVDVNVGAAGVFGPPDRGFPDDGVLIEGKLNEAGWIYSGVDFGQVEAVRREGQVFNFRHWLEQPGGEETASVSIVDLD